jgi:DNA repair protein RecO (recombination protein O)
VNIKDKGIILSIRKYSESSLIVKILSQNNGIYSGFIRSGLSNKKNASIYQTANLVEFEWRAKVEENLGFFKIELVKSFLGHILADPIKLHSLTSIISIIEQNILEREPHNQLYDELLDLLRNLEEENNMFLGKYIRLEIELLQILGYGIDLSRCAATDSIDDLQFVSPKSGRAVSGGAGEQYKDRLLKLPKFLIGQPTDDLNNDDLLTGLNLSGFFLEKYLYKPNNISIPEPRKRLVNLIKNK